jgi:hypothetical protein
LVTPEFLVQQVRKDLLELLANKELQALPVELQGSKGLLVLMDLLGLKERPVYKE